ncbi:MAG: hypothetical protein H6656_20235 [Ardenticatenaceae bacterium]|nr:hypothetical protein [Anaerolineales bacterium]MCB9009660.1 hypothetical protein [Ardenticatenaceae bacterium]
MEKYVRKLSRNRPLTCRKIIVIISASLLFWILVGYVLIVRSCLFLNCVQDRSFNALDLGLPPELFPDEAIVNPIARPSTLEGAFDGGAMTIYWRKGNGLATYRAWRYRRETEASNLFMVESRQALYRENTDLFYQSSLADEFYAGCGNQPNFGFQCIMAARYQEYTIRFNSMIDQDMSIEMFNEVIIFIDKQMGRYLYGE